MKIMGILNITDNSFSGDGLLNSASIAENCLKQAKAQIASGASILDVGAVSSKPSATEISANDEITRLTPVLPDLLSLDCQFSIDTYQPQVVEYALGLKNSHKITMINSIKGLETGLLELLLINPQLSIVIMHNSSHLAENDSTKTHYSKSIHQNVVKEVGDYLIEQASHAIEAGMKKDKIYIDPGLGFGKTPSENIEIIKNLNNLKQLGFKLLIGASRKSFLGEITNKTVDKRLPASLAVVATCFQKKVDMIRVHDVDETNDMIKTLKAINANNA